MKIALAAPSIDLYDSWASAVTEFGGVHIDGAGLAAGIDPTPLECAAFIEKAELYARPDAELPDGHVGCDYFWIVDEEAPAGERVVGFIAFRHELNDWLRRVGGHIGYSVRPSRRQEGIVTRALQLVLDRARAAGLDRVMLTCDDDNPGSYRTIERAGGELHDTVDAADAGHPRLRQYWIAL